MKKLSWIFVFILSVFLLIGCEQKDVEVKQVPQTMPADFGFELQFGVEKKNVVNTFEGTVTKDLIIDGTSSTKIVFSDEELQAIYERMKEVNVFEEKSYIPQPQSGVLCQKEPYEEDEWKIVMNGETITHSISSTYCDPTENAKEMLELRHFIWEIVKEKSEYKSLPAAVGGYE